jgi:hypothetical protein
MVPLTVPLFGVIFLRGHISLKNRSYYPVLRERNSVQTHMSSYKLEELQFGLYCRN